MSFENVERQTVYVDIQDMALQIDNSADPTVIQMRGAESPFVTSIIDTDEDKFTVVKSTQATIRFLSTDEVNLSTFADGPIPSGGSDPGDPRFYVEAYVNDPSQYIFKGHLNVHDCSESFMPYGAEVTLTATDGLGWLKDISLTNNDGETPRGYNRISEYIAWCLRKTRLNLFCNVVFNIRHEDYQEDHLFDIAFLHAKTFEDEVATCHDCYLVLEKILGEEAFICQRAGEWWIVRIDEIENGPIYRTRFDSLGDVESVNPATFYEKIILKDSTKFFSGEETSVTIVRPYRWIKEDFNFELPIEIIDNYNFDRGTLANFNTTTQTGNYIPDDWVLERQDGGIPQISAYIRRRFADTNQTDEAERYLAFTPGVTVLHWLKSNPVYLHQSDKFKFSFQRKLSEDQSDNNTATENAAQIRLYADDGTYYTLQNIAIGSVQAGQWVECNAAFTTNQQYIRLRWEPDQVNEAEEWQLVEVESKPMPKDGEIRVLFIPSTNFGNTYETYIQNLNFEYIPHLQGSYSLYSGRYHKVSRGEAYVSTREMEVKVSDSPKKLFKGGIHIENDLGIKVLAGSGFYNAAVYYNTPPPADSIHPYGHIQAFDVWNQHRNAVRRFEATIQGIDSASVVSAYVDSPHLIHRYFIADSSEHTFFRYFLCLTFEMDWYLCEWSATLIEVHNTSIGKIYSDTHEIKYLTE